MKLIACIITLTILAGCGASGKRTATDSSNANVQAVDTASQGATFRPYRLNEEYTVVDRGEYDSGPVGGSYEIVEKNGRRDTIDRCIGMQKAGDQGYLFQQLVKGEFPNESSKPGSTLSLDLGKYILTNGQQRTDLKSIAPNFDNYFSSASVINGGIYYWQIKKIDSTSKFSVSATRFSTDNKQITQYFLFNDGIQTDNPCYLLHPYLKRDTIYFATENGRVKKFSKDFKPYN